jgi:acyl-CoA thioesterase FadM
MSLWLRFFWVIVSGFFRKPLAVSDVAVLPQRVWPDELDINIHMNNAKYLAVMDLGRTDWIVRTGAWRLMQNERMAPVVGGSMVRFRRSLRPFQKFELRTRLLGWDERWLYVEQVMVSREGIACAAVQRTGFTLAGRLVTPAELAKKLHFSGPNVPAPAWVKDWSESDGAFYKDAESFLASNPSSH